MTTYYRAAGGVIAELFTPPDEIAIGECFTADVVGQFVAVPDGVSPAPGWTVGEGGALSAPIAVAPTQAQLLAYANSKVNALLAVPRSYDLAAAGGGAATTVKCDTLTATGADLLALNVWGALNPTATQPWVDDFGAVTTLTGAQFQALGLAVQAYGASVWAILASAASGIAAASITTFAEIDALSWPA